MRNIRNVRWALALGLALAILTGLGTKVQASTTATIDASSVVSSPPGFDFSTSVPDNLINSSGLSGTIGVGDDALKTHDAVQADMWLAENIASLEALTFTLDTTYNLLGIYVWNESENGGRDVKEFTIDTSTDGGSHFTPYDDSAIFTLTMSVGPPEHAQFEAFSASGVNAVRLDVVSNFGDINFVGLDEVRFEADIPEPASAAGLLAGLAAIGMRRRRSSRV